MNIISREFPFVNGYFCALGGLFFRSQVFLLDTPGNSSYNRSAIGVWRSLVSRLVRVQEASGSNPDTPTTSSQALYRLRRLFMRCIKKSSRAHAAAPPFQIEPTSLGFDLVNGDRKTQILSLHSDHVGAKSALLRRSFFSRRQKTSCACSRFFPNRTRAPEFKGTPPKNRPEENK